MSGNLEYKRQNAWEGKDSKEAIFALSEDYKEFLDKAKTERLAVKEIIRRSEEEGFKDLDLVLKEGKKLKIGDRVYKTNKDKGVVLFVIGSENIIDGFNLIGSHIDSPRLDLKQMPLYETDDIAYLKTHYYGGIIKYQWVTLPLELHGVVIKENGDKIEVSIGDGENDPVMYITDLLPHLGKEQMAKKASEVIAGEALNLIVGTIPGDEKEESVKKNILKILHEKYGIVEEDFISAEFEVVPFGTSKDVGFDRSMIAGYGQDDRVCAYTSLKALLEVDKPNKTAVGLFVDKEEIGSVGNTGMSAAFFENVLMDIVYGITGEYNMYVVKKALENSFALSADVAAGFDPEYRSAFEKNNAAELGKGIAIVKYTGARGKGGCSDANPEFVAKVRRIFNENNIIWQTSELGKVDQGGGGTIAFILAEYGMEVLDCGTAVLSMHSPFELTSKADVYMTYKGYKSFYLD